MYVTECQGKESKARDLLPHVVLVRVRGPADAPDAVDTAEGVRNIQGDGPRDVEERKGLCKNWRALLWD